jgi:hypothetical protein
MDEPTAAHEIARLEGQIEQLTGQLAWCAKISIAAKVAIAGCALWFALVLLGAFPFGATGFVAALSAGLGGVVLLGSNATSWDETEEKLRQTEAARAALIRGLNLRVVGEHTLH